MIFLEFSVYIRIFYSVRKTFYKAFLFLVLSSRCSALGAARVAAVRCPRLHIDLYHLVAAGH